MHNSGRACVCACASHQSEAGPSEVSPSPPRALRLRNPRLSLSIAPIMLPVGTSDHSSWPCSLQWTLCLPSASAEGMLTSRSAAPLSLELITFCLCLPPALDNPATG